jgi:hypothetical protein
VGLPLMADSGSLREAARPDFTALRRRLHNDRVRFDEDWERKQHWVAPATLGEVKALLEAEAALTAAEERERRMVAVVKAARNISGLQIGAWPELSAALARLDEESVDD